MTELQRTLSRLNGTREKEYGALVNRKLRARYSLSEELSILRKREEDPDAFAAYHAFAETCKRDAKAEIYGEEEKV
jgi:hypothetical protein